MRRQSIEYQEPAPLVCSVSRRVGAYSASVGGHIAPGAVVVHLRAVGICLHVRSNMGAVASGVARNALGVRVRSRAVKLSTSSGCSKRQGSGQKYPFHSLSGLVAFSDDHGASVIV